MTETTPRKSMVSPSKRGSSAGNKAGEKGKGGSAPPKPPKEYNPRWRAYVFLMCASLVSFASAMNVIRASRSGEHIFGILVGAFAFTLCIIVLAIDRFQCWESINFTKALDGRLEGYTLLFLVLWWTVGVAVLTRAGGIAYRAENIYFASWIAWGACLKLLDRWSEAKEILSWRELTALSATLKSWYCLTLSSLVVFITSADIYGKLYVTNHKAEASFAIALGIASFLISSFFVLVHYKFFPPLRQGGWQELASSFCLILFWTVGVALLTSDSGIAANITGQCYGDINPSTPAPFLSPIPTAAPTITPRNDTIPVPPSDFSEPIPGSNLYVFSWVSLLCSMLIASNWKAAQALQFAQAREKRTVNGEDDDDDDASSTDEDKQKHLVDDAFDDDDDDDYYDDDAI